MKIKAIKRHTKILAVLTAWVVVFTLLFSIGVQALHHHAERTPVKEKAAFASNDQCDLCQYFSNTLPSLEVAFCPFELKILPPAGPDPVANFVDGYAGVTPHPEGDRGPPSL